MKVASRTSHSFFLLAFTVLLAGCGGGGGDKPTGNTVDRVPASIAPVGSFGNPEVILGEAVPTAPSVVVKNAAGTPLANITVTFAVSAGGGIITGGTAQTNASGIATLGSWKVGTVAGTNTVTASVAGLTPAEFHATARLRRWTVMVYLAADNNLAVAGVGDIDEIEAAGVIPDVRMVIQAEFSPTWLGQAGCSTAACINRPNYNTFRYVPTGTGTAVDGPNSAATDIGNRNMADPAQLKEFILWAKEQHPAEHYALVLWNHGGGYLGLIEDGTSAGSRMMTMSELTTALTGTGKIDVIDFDMCLMGAYETLTKLVGLADYAVVSEEVVPGEGNPYTLIVDALQANPNADARTVAGLFVDEFNTSFAGNRASTTKSAFEMAGYAAFESSLNTLATTLKTQITPLRTSIDGAARGAQAYEFSELKDLGSVLDSLRVRTSDATLQGQIDAVKAQLGGTFRVRNRARNGAAAEAANVSRSSGMHVLLPSSAAADQLQTSGPRSFGAYSSHYTGKAWTEFLTVWLTGAAADATYDQGENRLEIILYWEPGAVAAGADIDLWVLEPSGDIYIPFLGTVTPNGHLTNDSFEDDTYFEGYLTNRYVQPGQYKFYAYLFSDASNFRPNYDVVYRTSQTGTFISLYSPTFPELSKTTPIGADPTPTLAEIEAGAYSDIKLAAYADLPPLSPGRGARRPDLLSSAPRIDGPTPTLAQLNRAREFYKNRGSRPAPRVRAVPMFVPQMAPR